MPCWYYDKKELKNTPSLRDGIDSTTESRYRREGAKFIIDAGTKMGLRHDTYATGVIYFHRFYMFHSFRQFHRYVTATSCLFLAGKVEETPKKCKDIVKTARTMLTDSQMQVFGEDPKEEVMIMERIILQTIKFDLMVEHPYVYILKFAKNIKGEKAKIEKMIQMAWTFVNDSFCTTLCLQWEPEIIGVALVHLASRLSKTDIHDWVGKQPGVKMKWWDYFVEDVSLELLEDVCHQMLDLYSAFANSKAASKEKAAESPPPPPPPKPAPSSGSSSQSASKRKSGTPKEAAAAQGVVKRPRPDSPGKAGAPDRRGKIPITQAPKIANPHAPPPGPSQGMSGAPAPPPPAAPGYQAPPPGGEGGGERSSSFNPYMSQGMYTNSFSSQEASENIKSLMGSAPAGAAAGNNSSGAGYSDYRPGQRSYPPPPPSSSSTHQSPYPQTGGYQQSPYQQQPVRDYHHGSYPQQSPFGSTPGSQHTPQQHNTPQQNSQPSYKEGSYNQNYSYPQNYSDNAGYSGHQSGSSAYPGGNQGQWSGGSQSASGSQFKGGNYNINTQYRPNTPTGSRPPPNRQQQGPGGVASIRISNRR